MPEMRFHVRWPDGAVTACYSPSLVVKDFLQVGKSYPLDDFVARSRESLTIASERVRQKYGFHCTGAAAQLEGIEARAREFEGVPIPVVEVIAFE